MLFTSPDFLFAFLPAFLLLNLAAPVGWRNALLLGASLLFYFATSGALTVILVGSIVVNHVVARRIATTDGARRAWLLAGLAANLGPLLYFKYAHFFLGALGGLLPGMALPNVSPVLPIGISFFTFQAVSYLADVYARRVVPARSLIDFGMYHSCFPQVIAGPIVRYEDVAGQIRNRTPSLDGFYNGAVQFCYGLAKKAILADPIGTVADAAFALPPPELGFASAWLGVMAYTLQIYLDFSAYSDMAIGLGRMLGFTYPENFDQPYLSRSITEFWRRWHMTLSRWFRDYVYVPLGGNRAGLPRTLLNLWTVFFLCGLWHGAAYPFIVWGLYHGALLVGERMFRGSLGVPGWIGWCYSMLAVMLGWVFFRADSVAASLHWLRVMAMPDRLGLAPVLGSVLTNDKVAAILLGLAVSFVPYRWFFQLIERQYAFGLRAACCSLALAVIAFGMLSVESFTPFIYFRF